MTHFKFLESQIARMLSHTLFLPLLCGCGGSPELPPGWPPTVEHVDRQLRFVYGLPVLDVEIGGETIPLFLDLGGFDSIALETRQLDRVPVTFTGKSKSYTDISGKRFISRGYRLSEVNIGGITLRDVAGNEHIHEPGDPETTRMGYLGRAVLEKFRLIVDFPARRLVLMNGLCAHKDHDISGWQKWPLQSTRSGASVEILIDGWKRRVILDTAAGRSRLRPSAAEGLPTQNRDGDSMAHAGELRLGDQVLGPHDFHVGTVAVPGVDGLLGSPFFMNHVVYIDFESKFIAVR